MSYNIVCCTDDNYAQYCGVMLCSLLDNNKDNELIIHVLINQLSEENRNKLNKIVEFYNSKIIFHIVDESKLDGVKFRIHNPLSKAAYYRLLLSSVLPNVSIVLYFDCDMIILKNIAELFKLEINDYALAAVADHSPESDLHRRQLSLSYGSQYFCSGILLINLDYWRKNNSEEKLIEYSKRDRYVFLHDQDSLNYVFKNKWFVLPPKWNRLNLAIPKKAMFDKRYDEQEYFSDPCVIHYATKLCKPWYNIHFLRYKSLYIKYLHKTPWKDAKPLKCKNKKTVYFVMASVYFNNFIYSCPPLIGLLLLMLYDIIRFCAHVANGRKINSFVYSRYKNL